MTIPERLQVVIPPRWLTPVQFEDVVAGHDFVQHLQKGGVVIFVFPPRSALPAGLGLWLLSFLNQLAAIGSGRIHLQFDQPEELFGYLDRSGFLSLLSDSITMTPPRPSVSSAQIHRGRTQGLVEIEPLIPGTTEEEKKAIVSRLVDALIGFYPPCLRTRRLRSHVFTVFGELVDNVFSHSQTTLPGYASLQAYQKQEHPRVQLGVSDSGLGIPSSLRANLGERLERQSDAELVVRAFKRGLSRHGLHAGRGCGLFRCASLVATYGSKVYVRTPSAQVILDAVPGTSALQAQIDATVAPMKGTHICLEFRVDHSGRE